MRPRCLYVWRHAGPQQHDRRHAAASVAIIRCKVSVCVPFSMYVFATRGRGRSVTERRSSDGGALSSCIDHQIMALLGGRLRASIATIDQRRATLPRDSRLETSYFRLLQSSSDTTIDTGTCNSKAKTGNSFIPRTTTFGIEILTANLGVTTFIVVS